MGSFTRHFKMKQFLYNICNIVLLHNDENSITSNLRNVFYCTHYVLTNFRQTQQYVIKIAIYGEVSEAYFQFAHVT